MESISRDRWAELIDSAHDVAKIELRDFYGSDADIYTAWRSGDLDAVAASYRNWLEYFTTEYIDAGRTYRRVRVVSEPLSDYQTMALTYSGITVDAGEGLRWLPRRFTSALALPGNDCLLLDGKTVVFNVLDPDATELVETQYSSDPEVVAFCQKAFDAAWKLATPHHEYLARMTAA